MIRKCLWSTEKYGKLVDIALLLFRIMIAGLLLSHGIEKLSNFETLKGVFPDPLGVGNMTSLILILFAEVGCSIMVLFGFLTRFAAIPIIFGMCIAVFYIHAADPFQVKELAVIYLGSFTVLFISGPGKISVDNLISRFIYCRKNPE